MTTTTLESTTADDENRRRREGSVLYAKTKALLDELVQRRAQDAAHAAEIDRLRPDPGRARASRTADLEALITAAIAEITARLETQHRSARTTALVKYVNKRNGFKPTRAVIQRVLKKHGLY